MNQVLSIAMVVVSIYALVRLAIWGRKHPLWALAGIVCLLAAFKAIDVGQVPRMPNFTSSR